MTVPRHLKPYWVWIFVAVGMVVVDDQTALAQEEALCASVEIEILQDLTLERQGFDAGMRISNGLTGISIDDIAVTVHFEDDLGNPVEASSDPQSSTAVFFIDVAWMQDIDAVDGTGTIAEETVGEVHWTIIPAPGASAGQSQGTRYLVGATLTYTVAGEAEEVEVIPDSILVKPQPDFELDYFLPSEVRADDPLTATVEPIEPFTLGVRVKNNGSGTARRVAIESAQPEIVNNQLGLLIDFSISGSYVNDQAVSPELRLFFSDVGPGEAAMGRWVMESTLAGEFVEFTADYTHSDDFGGELTSLLSNVETHTLLRDVIVDLPGRDGIRDFLGQDGVSVVVYESNGVDTATADVSGTSSIVLQSTNGWNRTYTLTTPTTAGPMYVSLTDPEAGALSLLSATRADGKTISLRNAWVQTTDTGFNTEHFMRLFDVDGGGDYTLVLGPAPAQPAAPVLSPVASTATVEGIPVVVPVSATDPNGDPITLSTDQRPAGSSFVDLGAGTGSFSWTPAAGQSGTFPVTFRASDGALTAVRTAFVTVFPSEDTDGDGMDDSWENDNFGNLDRDGTGDADGDGVSDLDEFLAGTDPNAPPPAAVPIGGLGTRLLLMGCLAAVGALNGRRRVDVSSGRDRPSASCG